MTTSKEFKEEIVKYIGKCLGDLWNLVGKINEANEKNFIIERITDSLWNGKSFDIVHDEYQKVTNKREFKQMVKLVEEISNFRRVVYNSDLWETVYQRENFPYDFKE